MFSLTILDFKTDLSEGKLWYGVATHNRPGSTNSESHYVGLSGTLGFLSMLKASAFLLFQALPDESLSSAVGGTVESADSTFLWFGATVGFDAWNPFAIEGTFIGNYGRSKMSTGAESFFAYLADVKASLAINAMNSTLTLEGLMTSGANNSVDTAASPNVDIASTRKHFVSPIGTSYLLTIATSDGVDDAPGSTRNMPAAGLATPEGLLLAVATFSTSFMKEFTAFVRYGFLNTMHNGATGSKALGNEFDIGAVYQVTPSSILQLDVGMMLPGNYFTPKNAASLVALRYKFSF